MPIFLKSQLTTKLIKKKVFLTLREKYVKTPWGQNYTLLHIYQVTKITLHNTTKEANHLLI